ncbi:MAG: hypothetical protein HRU40_22330, partial [Saprospiraceae bacterium]|nr:hypothetical protein [Saprospiraceae bacterium]
GSHQFLVEARVGCGNKARDVFPFVLADFKAQAPICANQINVEIMPTEPGTAENGLGVVWANDFLRSPIFDCSGQGEQGRVEKFSINRATSPADSTQQSVMFSCLDIGELVEVHIYAWDEAGNGDHCTAYVDVQDNDETCVPDTNNVSGVITTESGVPVENVEMLLSGGEERIVHTDERGMYIFERLRQGRNYTIRPGLNVDHSNGVSTYDLILIQKHVLGIAKFTSPYQLIAADVNNSGGVSTLDLIQLRRLILGLGDSFLGNQSWRFINSKYTFDDPNEPWTEAMPETMDISALREDRVLDFMAIKIGDVNGNAQVNSSQPATEVRNDDQLKLLIDDILLQAGRVYSIPVYSNDLAGIQGLQFTLETNDPDMQITSIRSALLGQDHMGEVETGKVWTFSWNKTPGLPLEAATLFTLEVKVQQDTRLRDALRLSSSVTSSEAYNTFDELLAIDLSWATKGIGTEAFDILEVTPNPFVEQAKLRFSLPGPEEVSVEIFNVKGQRIFLKKWILKMHFYGPK